MASTSPASTIAAGRVRGRRAAHAVGAHFEYVRGRAHRAHMLDGHLMQRGVEPGRRLGAPQRLDDHRHPAAPAKVDRHPLPLGRVGGEVDLLDATVSPHVHAPRHVAFRPE